MDIMSILKVLERHRVRYVLFGTVGAIAYGADLSPGDLDICPALDEGNLLRLAGALEELGARPKYNPPWNTREECDRWAPAPLAEETFDTIFETPYGDLDVVPRPYGPNGKVDRFEYGRLDERAETSMMFGLPVRVAGVEDLIASKMSRRREKDLRALPELERIRGRVSG